MYDRRFQEQVSVPEDGLQSEFYHLRRTAIKDLAAYCGFLIGFLGASPFAWSFLSDELETGGIVRGLWYFFALVSVAGVACGAAGLAIGYAVGWTWERYHRWRRAKRAAPGGAATAQSSLTPADEAAESPILQLIPARRRDHADLVGKALTSVRFRTRGVELEFDGALAEMGDNAVVISAGQTLNYPEPGSRDALCGLIGAIVESVNITSNRRIELRFNSGRELVFQRIGSAAG